MVSAVILAGGEARRMGGKDKGLLLFAGQPLIHHVISRIAPQVDELRININRNWNDYSQFGYPLIMDGTAQFLGPLAGVLAGLTAFEQEWVLTVPCDTPYLPGNLVSRLFAATDYADVVVARTSRIHATVMLCRRSLAANLHAALQQGTRKVQDWQARQRLASVLFTDEAAFVNINTLEQLDGSQNHE